MENELKPGDIVKIAHEEHHEMTIEYIDEYDYASCVYFDQNNLFAKARIHIKALKKV